MGTSTGGSTLDDLTLEDLAFDTIEDLALDEWAELEKKYVDAEFAAIVEANFGDEPPEPPDRPVPADEPATPRNHRRWPNVSPRCLRRPHTVGVRKERSPPSRG